MRLDKSFGGAVETAASLCISIAAFLIPLAVVPHIQDASILPKWGLIQFFGGLCGLLYIIHSLLLYAYGETERPLTLFIFNKPLLFILSGLLLISFSGLIAPSTDLDPFKTVYNSLNSEPSNINIFARYADINPVITGESAKWLLRFTGLAGLLAGAFICGRTHPEWLFYSLASALILIFTIQILQIAKLVPPYSRRAGSSLGNAAWLGSWLAIYIPFWIGNTTHRKVCGILFVISLISLVLTGAKASLIGTGVSLLILIPWKKAWSTPSLRKMILISPMLLLIPLFYLRYASSEYRIYLMNISRGIISENPISGSGLGTYNRAAMKYQYQWLQEENSLNLRHRRTTITNAHFDILQIFSETGPIGVIGYFTIFTGLIIYSGKLKRLALSLSSALIVTGLFDFPFFVPATSSAFFIFAGWITGKNSSSLIQNKKTASFNSLIFLPQALIYILLFSAVIISSPLMVYSRHISSKSKQFLLQNEPRKALQNANKAMKLWPPDHLPPLLAARAILMMPEEFQTKSNISTARDLARQSRSQFWTTEATETEALALEALNETHQAALMLDMLVTGLNRNDLRRTRWILTGLWLKSGDIQKAAESLIFWFYQFNQHGPGKNLKEEFVQAYLTYASLQAGNGDIAGAISSLDSARESFPEITNNIRFRKMYSDLQKKNASISNENSDSTGL